MEKFIWFTFLFLFFIITSSSSTITETNNTIVIPLSTSRNLYGLRSQENLIFLAYNSLSRVRHLKQKSKSFHSNIRIFPQMTGDILFPLSFGTPPQTLHFHLDTGSSLVWFPCGPSYSCHECFPSTNQMTNIVTFDPRKSLSSRPIGCSTSKCQLFKNQYPSQCQSIHKNDPQNCSHFTYNQKYGSGFTTGVYLFETVKILKQTKENFIVGCSSSSTNIPNGIVGLGRSNVALPAQLGLEKFGYCLSSRWSDKEQESYLVLNSGFPVGLTYTPFQKNPSIDSFLDFYYVVLESIMVDRKPINIPHELLVPGADGHGGTIIDSGTTLTFLERSIFEAVTREFEEKIGRDAKVDNVGIMGPCFNVSHKKLHDLPKLSFQFRGGAVMNLSFDNYFLFGDDEKNILCLSIVSDESCRIPNGPTIILGSIQHQNFYVEYDLKNERLGFREERC